MFETRARRLSPATRFALALTLALLLGALRPAPASANFSISALDTDFTIDFDTGGSFPFTGGGFAPSPAAGQIDSDEWRAEGFSEGNTSFGSTDTTGDFARGAHAGGAGTGGVYGFDISNGGTVDRALGVQPIGADFTPGEFTLRIQNNTGSTIEELDVAYDVYIYNDHNRSNSFNFSHSADDSSYTAIGALDVTSVEAAAGTPTWTANARSTTITGLSITAGSFYYLRWQGDDVGGSGSRDEFALDNVVLNASQAMAVEMLGMAIERVGRNVHLRWETASEIKHAGFNLIRVDAEGGESQVNRRLIRPRGGELAGGRYHRIDWMAPAGRLQYWIEDVDVLGQRTRHGPLVIGGPRAVPVQPVPTLSEAPVSLQESQR